MTENRKVSIFLLYKIITICQQKKPSDWHYNKKAEEREEMGFGFFSVVLVVLLPPLLLYEKTAFLNDFFFSYLARTLSHKK